MGRIRQLLDDDATPDKTVAKVPRDHHADMLKHALGLAHAITKLKKSGKFAAAKKAAR